MHRDSLARNRSNRRVRERTRCGVSGSAVEHDEECCVYGVQKAGFEADNAD